VSPLADAPGKGRPDSARVTQATVTLAHGAGGRAMRRLIEDVFVGSFCDGPPPALEDQARLPLAAFTEVGGTLAFTTDSFVIDPLFFPGGDIGRLAVCGTVNDLAVGGARPVALSCAVILEEGLPIDDLRRIAASMRSAADEAGVAIVTGDTKVVQRGAADKIFINTGGIGIIPDGRNLAAAHIRPGDVLIVNSTIGEHGAAVMAARGDLGLQTSLVSDCRALNHLAEALLEAVPEVRALRDATRGGVAAVLNEFALAAGVCCLVEEAAIPLQPAVRGIAEILGLDPLYLANEGLMVAAVPPGRADAALGALRHHAGGERAAVIGEVRAAPVGMVVMRSLFGGERLVDLLDGEQLPRIC
jgi:hydrogenase expression/formation protein HypE